MPQAILDQYPLRLLIGQDDCTFLLDSGFTYSNVDGGGFEAASFPIPKDMPETLVGQYVRLDSGLQVAWEGRVSEIQRSLGNKTTVTCEGLGAVLKEQFMSEVYVDRDLTRWSSPSYTRQASLAAANEQLASTQVAADPTNNVPALVQSITDSWTSPNLPLAEAWYDAGPENLIAKLYYNINEDATVAGVANWLERLLLSSDANASTIELSSNLNGVPTQGYFTPVTAYRFAFLQHVFNSTAGGGVQGSTYNAYWHYLTAYGNHGLTGRGGDPVGFYTSDIVGHALSQQSTIQPGIIDAVTGYIVPHYVQYTPVAIEQIMSDMAALEGCHWGTWESLAYLTGNLAPRFDFRPYPTTPTCWCMRQDCDTLDVNEQLAGLFDSVQVTYTDVAGVQQAVLVALDNPFLDDVGLHRTTTVDIGTSTPADAALFGAQYLQTSQTQARAAGTAVFSGLVGTSSGRTPAWMLRAGIDRLRVADLPGQNAWGTTNDFNIARVEASISTDGVQTSVELGVGANLEEVLTARMQAATALAAVI